MNARALCVFAYWAYFDPAPDVRMSARRITLESIRQRVPPFKRRMSEILDPEHMIITEFASAAVSIITGLFLALPWVTFRTAGIDGSPNYLLTYFDEGAWAWLFAISGTFQFLALYFELTWFRIANALWMGIAWAFIGFSYWVMYPGSLAGLFSCLLALASAYGLLTLQAKYLKQLRL